MIPLLQQQDELLQGFDLQENTTIHFNTLQLTATHCNSKSPAATAQ